MKDFIASDNELPEEYGEEEEDDESERRRRHRKKRKHRHHKAKPLDMEDIDLI